MQPWLQTLPFHQRNYESILPKSFAFLPPTNQQRSGQPLRTLLLTLGMAIKTSRLFEFEGIAWHFWEDEYDQKVFSSTVTYGQGIQPVVATLFQNLEFLKLRLYEDIDRLAIESCMVQTHSSLRGDLQLCLSAWPTQLP